MWILILGVLVGFVVGVFVQKKNPKTASSLKRAWEGLRNGIKRLINKIKKD